MPDLEHAKAAGLNSLTSPDAQRGNGQAIDEFVDRYGSEPRLTFNRIVVFGRLGGQGRARANCPCPRLSDRIGIEPSLSWSFEPWKVAGHTRIAQKADVATSASRLHFSFHRSH